MSEYLPTIQSLAVSQWLTFTAKLHTIVVVLLCIPSEPPIGKFATPDFDPAESKTEHVNVSYLCIWFDR